MAILPTLIIGSDESSPFIPNFLWIFFFHCLNSASPFLVTGFLKFYITYSFVQDQTLLTFIIEIVIINEIVIIIVTVIIIEIVITDFLVFTVQIFCFLKFSNYVLPFWLFLHLFLSNVVQIYSMHNFKDQGICSLRAYTCFCILERHVLLSGEYAPSFKCSFLYVHLHALYKEPLCK